MSCELKVETPRSLQIGVLRFVTALGGSRTEGRCVP